MLSDDGKWCWTGAEWIPAPPSAPPQSGSGTDRTVLSAPVPRTAVVRTSNRTKVGIVLLLGGAMVAYGGLSAYHQNAEAVEAAHEATRAFGSATNSAELWTAANMAKAAERKAEDQQRWGWDSFLSLGIEPAWNNGFGLGQSSAEKRAVTQRSVSEKAEANAVYLEEVAEGAAAFGH